MKKNWDMFIPKDSERIENIVINGKATTYLASSKGYIINTDYRMSGKSCILKESTNRYGYKTVCLYIDKIRKTYKVHRLIALAFLPNPLNLREVNHINGDKNNNSVENLEWCNRTHNMRHAVEHGLHYAVYGEDHPETIYTNKQIHAVCKYLEKGKKTIKEISLKTGVSPTTITDILHYGARKDVSCQYDLSKYDAVKLKNKANRLFTDKQIIAVCKELVKKQLPMYKIAEKTGVSYTVVKLINARKYKTYEYIYKNYNY